MPARRPRPTPPRDARPAQLSVTQVEDLLRDPYTIYARHILELRPLDAVDTPPGARDRGTVIHGAIGDFTEKYANALPADPLGAGRTFRTRPSSPDRTAPRRRRDRNKTMRRHLSDPPGFRAGRFLFSPA